MKWEKVKLGDLIKANYGKALKADERDETGNFPVFGSSGKVGNHSKTLTNEATIIIGRKGSVGAITFATSGGWTIDTAYFVEILNKERVDLRYLFWALKSARLSELTITTSIPGLNRDSLYRVQISLPPLEEQERIAALLDAADQLRAQRREALARLDALTHALFLDSFGDPAHNPKNWPIVKLPELCRPKQWPTIAASQLSGSGYPVFGANGLIGHHHTFNHAEETVLITCRGATCGTINICPPKTYVTGNAMALDDLAIDKVNRAFLQWYLKLKGLANVISGTAQPQITGQGLATYGVALPPLSLQQQFAERLGQIETIRARMDASRLELDALFASLQQQAFGE